MPKLTLTPGKHGVVEITDESGAPYATRMQDGNVRTASGASLAAARVLKPSRPDRPLECRLDLADASGDTIGIATVAKYKVTPRTKQLSVAVGDEVRFEVVDDRGEQLVVTAAGSDVGRMDIATEKAGFLRKRRIYTLQFDDSLGEPARTVVLAVAAGYEALLQAVLGAAMRD